jgi:LuxR family maltose regulon positive regulatory protein
MENTKLYPEAPRAALMALLDELSAAKRLIYIHAPAGYGKTYSSRMWLKRMGLPSAWIAVSESSGRKPSEFCERFTLALLTLQPDNAELKKTAKLFTVAPYENMEHAIKAFQTYNAVEQHKHKMILVMDDLQLITNMDTEKRLPGLIRELPENITVFLLSRAEPPESFYDYIVRDAMAVVDVESLKFSDDEIAAFFTSRGRKLTGRQAQDIMASTGGWAIGLNALLLSGNEKYSSKKLNRYLEAFIREQVWDKWDKTRQDFLLRVSVSDELTPDFCDAMTDRKDSAEILSALVNENAFTSVDGEGVYRFHHLFSDFLRHLLERENEKLRKVLYQTAGDWFYSRADYYRAVEYYIRCGSKDGIAKGLTLMYNYNSPYASVEDTAAIIRLSVDNAVVDEYPFLLETLAWASFVEGRGDEMEKHLDLYNKQFAKVIMQNPASALTSVLLRCMDYRNSFIGVLRGVQKSPFKRFARSSTPSITQNMTFFHRSSRDFSELLSDEDGSFDVFKKTWGVMLKDEYEVVEKSIRAGLAYERGELDAAHELALSACAAIKENFAPEIQFCAYMIRAAVADAQGQRSDTRKALDEAAAMIERYKAYYLEANYQAFHCRLKLNDGDMDAARNWLKWSADQPHGHLLFFKLFRHFTTARAYIVAGDYDTAILFLKKILALCEQYRRPLDIIEAKVLMAIAYWKKGRNEAFVPLEQAILSAQEYGFVQVFANEGVELSNMLHKLKKRVVQADYDGRISDTMVKSLYILTSARARHSSGLTGRRAPVGLTFTEQQKKVMRHLCDGLSRNQIAEKMGLKPTAIKSHTQLIYKKLDVATGMDAIIKIKELGLLNSKQD